MRPPRKSPGSWQHQLCPAPEEIREYKYGHLDPARRAAVGLHLRHCRVCMEIFKAPHAWHQDEPEPAENMRLKADIEKKFRHRKRRSIRPPDPLHLKRGQVWTVAPPPPGTTLTSGEQPYMGTPVVIMDPGDRKRKRENKIRCMPLSSDIAFHLPSESLVIQEADSPLGYPVLVEAFNERPMQASDLHRYQGDLKPEVLDTLEQIKDSMWSLDPVQEAAAPPEYQAWKRLEIEMAAYLSAPVNEALWAEEDDQEKKVWLHPVRLAADSGISLQEIHPTLLWQDERLAAGIVQSRDRVYLKVVWGQASPGPVKVDGRSLEAGKGDDEEQYFDLGVVETIAGVLNIEIHLDADVIRIRADFKERPAEE